MSSKEQYKFNKEYTFLVDNGYRWKVMDKYGWGISKQKQRDMQINNIFDDVSYEDILLVISMRSGVMKMIDFTLDFDKHEMIVSGEYEQHTVYCKFVCNNFEESYPLIDNIKQAMGLEVMPISDAKFEQK